MRKKRFIKCIVALITPLSLLACNDGGSSTSAETESSQKSRLSYAISVNESEKTIHSKFPFDYTRCKVENSVAKWDSLHFVLDLLINYNINDNKLTLDAIDLNDSNEMHFHDLTSKSNNSIYGTWNIIPSEDQVSGTYTFTADSMIIDVSIAPPLESEPIESTIKLSESYFLYDFYKCADEINCTFSPWHFSKSANSFFNPNNNSIDMKTTIKDSRNVVVSYNEKDFYFHVENVQDDSLNQGRAFYSAYIATENDTCNYEFIRQNVDKDLCTTENIEYMMGYGLYDDEEELDSEAQEGNDAFIGERYVKTNSDDFAKCVLNLIKL